MSKFWQRLSKRERRLSCLDLADCCRVRRQVCRVTPFLERREWVKSQLESQPQLLQKNLRYLGQKEALLGSLEAARGQIKAQEPRLLTGDTPSVSASDLQETVQALATREGTQVITTRVLNPEPAGSFSKIGIQLEIGGQIQQVANLIRGIETAPKLLVIDEVNVRSLFRPLGFPQPQGVPQVNTQNLRISLTVTGFARVQPAVAAPSSNSGKPAKAADEKPV